MKNFRAIVLDLYRCVGCFACELACKQENDLPEGVRWIKVVTIGPKKLNGKMCMDFLLDISDECTFCNKCVETCSTEALMVCDDDRNVLELLRSNKRYQVCHIHSG